MSKPVHSPFFVRQNFLSPLTCDDLVDAYGLFIEPDVNKELEPIKTIRFDEDAQTIIGHHIDTVVEELEEWFRFEYKGTINPVKFEWYPEGCKQNISCENSEFMNGHWVKTKQNDFTGIIFLTDSANSQEAYDPNTEVYGGKLEFLNHGFGFNPSRGTLVVFPSGPHFVNNIAPVLAGDLFVVRFHIRAEGTWLYQPSEFPGDFTTWFADVQ